MLTENSSYNDRTIDNAIKVGFKLKIYINVFLFYTF